LRETSDPVELAGIARTWKAIEKASIALLMTDTRQGVGEPEQLILSKLPTGIARLNVHNKIDLTNEAPGVVEESRCADLRVSAKTGAGVDLLRVELLRLAGWQPSGEGAFMARARHLESLKIARAALQNARDLSDRMELQAEELRAAQQALSSITGEFTADDLLGEIFSRFCIGK
jgi:tRNA modification GTPase